MSKNTKNSKNAAAKNTKAKTVDKKVDKKADKKADKKKAENVVVEEVAEEIVKPAKVKKPISRTRLIIAIFTAIFTLCLGAACGYVISNVCLAKGQHVFMSVEGNPEIAAANGYDTSLVGSFFDQSMKIIIPCIIGTILFVALYGGKKRVYYLLECALANTASMLIMNFLFIPKTAGMAAYQATYDIYFWILLPGVFCGAIFTEIVLLMFSVLRFRRLENKGLVNEEGVFISNLELEAAENAAADAEPTPVEEPVKKSKKLKAKKA